MASAVDIANIALSHLGDAATVTSIDPPEGSAQAEHCQRFYGPTLAAILEMHNWSFATKRTSLAQISNPSSTWAYCYAQPSDAVNVIAILAPDAQSDFSTSLANTAGYTGVGTAPLQGTYTQQPFIMESTSDGTDIILTNQANAVLIYSYVVTDTTRFSPLFVEAFAWLLASKLAGPVIKGSEAIKATSACLQQFQYWYGQAVDSDSSQRKLNMTPQISWMNARA